MANDISLKKATLITAISKYSNIFLSIAFSAVLSRILTPNDYGIVAIVTVFTTFFGLFSNFGFSSAIIQKKNLSQIETDSLFTFSFYIALILGSIFFLLSYPISLFYSNPVYIPICILLVIPLFFKTLNTVPNAILSREKRFILIAVRSIVVTIATYGLTIVFALLNFKYYALVIQSILSSVFGFIWNLTSVQVRLVRHPDKKILDKIKGYSGFQFLFDFVNYFSRNLDNLIIGKVWGNAPLAQYSKAYRLMLYPVQNLTHVITPVLHPILAKYQDDYKFIYEKYIKICKLLSLLGVYITAVCHWGGKEAVLIVFGSQWTDAASCFQILAFSIWAQMVTSSSGSIFQSIGNTKLMFISSLVNTSITIAGIITGLMLGTLETVSYGITIAYSLHFFFLYIFLIGKGMHRNVLHFYKNFIPDWILLISMIIATKLLTPVIPMQNLFFSFFTKGFVLLIIYMTGLTFLGQWQYLTSLLPSRFKIKK